MDNLNKKDKAWDEEMSNAMAAEEEAQLRELNTRDYAFDRKHLCGCEIQCEDCKCALDK